MRTAWEGLSRYLPLKIMIERKCLKIILENLLYKQYVVIVEKEVAFYSAMMVYFKQWLSGLRVGEKLQLVFMPSGCCLSHQRQLPPKPLICRCFGALGRAIGSQNRQVPTRPF